jgi:hypothetical protein
MEEGQYFVMGLRISHLKINMRSLKVMHSQEITRNMGHIIFQTQLSILQITEPQEHGISKVAHNLDGFNPFRTDIQ